MVLDIELESPVVDEPLVVAPDVVAPELVDGAVADVLAPYAPAELADGLAPEVVFMPAPALPELGALVAVDGRAP